jgi:protein phosphatase
MPTISEMDTALFEAVPAEGTDRHRPVVRADLAGLSHRGNVRANNEDHFLVTRFGRFMETLETNLPAGDLPGVAEEIGYGMAVADGIGGHAAGEVASRLAITTMVKLVRTTPDWILRVDQDLFSEEVVRRAKERYDQVNALLAEQAETDATLSGYGTTLTMAWSVGTDLFIANLGDSRAYLLRHSELYQLTHDHTVAQGLVDIGIIAQHQVATHQLRHTLTKSLGLATRESAPDVRKLILEDGDCLLLCTDGLTDMVANPKIHAILADREPAARSCQRLVDAALQAGGKDNVTVVVVRYGFCQPTSSAAQVR